MTVLGARVPAQAHKIVPAEYGDAAAVFEVVAERLPLAREPFLRLWEWMYLENPAYRAGESVGWKAERGGQVVAFLGAIPSWVCVGHDEVRGQVVTEFVSRRGEGIVGLRIARAVIEAPGSFVLSGSANSTTAAIFSRLGCQFVPGVPAGRYVFPLSERPIRAVLARKLRASVASPARRTGLIAARAAAGLAGPVLRPALAAVFGMNRLRRRAVRLRARFACEPLNEPAGDLTAIWQRSRARYPVSIRRDPAYLRWRFFDFPFGNVRVYLVSEASAGVVGYFALQDMQTLPGVLLLDLGHDPARPESLAAAVAFALTEVLERNAEMFLAVAHCAAIDRELARWTLIRQRLEASPCLFRNNTVAASAKLSDPDAWWLSPGDSDIAYNL